VGYQLMQAGAQVAGIVEAMPRVGGYAVHAGKILRAGVPLYLSHTILRALGKEHVEAAVITRVGEDFCPIPGTEQELACDTVLLAAGLSPRTDIAAMFGLAMAREPRLGGWLPLHDEGMAASVPGVFVAGDLAGVEEASTAMDEGRLAGLSAAVAAGYAAPPGRQEELLRSVDGLRRGPHGEARRQAKLAVVREFADRGN